ncbi:hypothetical protein DICVIV_08634 [Dictyocaulus viviparus]|uniref:Cytoplasmic polyadenylation element-binding protein 1 n=1 Tax=Dictyocaulus viviparus TaxID=29172 RepID=A0A0D8XNK4_DICVI|nr:hypothetical protein DICVIV_08634 [Dictyocaulus viviparus]
MSKRGFLNLNDDNFWGNDDSKTESNNETDNCNIIAKDEDNYKIDKDVNITENGIDEARSRWTDKVEVDGWEAVKGEMVKRNGGKIDTGNPFRYNSPLGGFSRTNAALYYQEELGKRNVERYQPRRSNESYQLMRGNVNAIMEAGQMDTHIDLLSRKDFSALDALNAIYRDKCFIPSNVQRERCITRKNNDDGDERERWERELLSSSGSGSSVTEQSGDGPRVGFSRTDLNMIDEQYADYYEYLCQGIHKLLESGITLEADCDSRGSSPSFQQPSMCRALKSKYYYQYNLGPEIYSRKVFVGGLPIDIEEGRNLYRLFYRFERIHFDMFQTNWLRYLPVLDRYVFLIFDHETSVRTLVQHCTIEDEKLFLFISSPINSEKLKVQIRPWRLADADYLVDVNVPINLRRVVFVGGVPRPIRAVELAHIMDRLYGSVACAGIDTDVEYKYPKGAGRVAFTNYNSYMKAITERYAQLSHGEVEKRVEMKPYVLDDQICEECIREPNGGKHAPFFCPHLECLQYYCESCWTSMHGSPSREHHKPLVKEA